MADRMDTCATCRHWNRFSDQVDNLPASGQCRKRAPALVAQPSLHGIRTESAWPLVDGNDWCGEYQNIRG